MQRGKFHIYTITKLHSELEEHILFLAEMCLFQLNLFQIQKTRRIFLIFILSVYISKK